MRQTAIWTPARAARRRRDIGVAIAIGIAIDSVQAIAPSQILSSRGKPMGFRGMTANRKKCDTDSDSDFDSGRQEGRSPSQTGADGG
jgi:hypothetical protein